MALQEKNMAQIVGVLAAMFASFVATSLSRAT
jgi:hypothetical protein